MHPAAAVLNLAWQEFQKVQNNRGKLQFHLERCRRVIGAIDQELDRKPALDVERSIEQLMRYVTVVNPCTNHRGALTTCKIRHLRFIEQMMRNLARLGFMKSLLRKDEIMAQIEEAHLRLTDCLAIFQVSPLVSSRIAINAYQSNGRIRLQVTSAVDLREYSEDLERARIADQEELSTQLALLERNDVEVMRRFDVLNNQVEAMMAIQSVSQCRGLPTANVSLAFLSCHFLNRSGLDQEG